MKIKYAELKYDLGNFPKEKIYQNEWKKQLEERFLVPAVSMLTNAHLENIKNGTIIRVWMEVFNADNSGDRDQP